MFRSPVTWALGTWLGMMMLGLGLVTILLEAGTALGVLWIAPVLLLALGGLLAAAMHYPLVPIHQQAAGFYLESAVGANRRARLSPTEAGRAYFRLIEASSWRLAGHVDRAKAAITGLDPARFQGAFAFGYLARIAAVYADIGDPEGAQVFAEAAAAARPWWLPTGRYAAHLQARALVLADRHQEAADLVEGRGLSRWIWGSSMAAESLALQARLKAALGAPDEALLLAAEAARMAPDSVSVRGLQEGERPLLPPAPQDPA